MTDKKVRSPLSSFKYSAEMSRFRGEVESANENIARISNMSDDELSAMAQKNYDRGIAFYKRRLEEIAIKGEDYEGEKAELEAERNSLRLLSPQEWKEKTLKGEQCRKEFYEDEMADIKERYYPVVSPLYH